MKNVLPPLIGVLVATLAGACTAAPAAQPTDSKTCSLTAAEKTANAHLSFDDFDQKGVTTGSGRSLGSRGCWEAAAAATEDYILHGPDRTDGEQRNLLFHLAQMRALA